MHTKWRMIGRVASAAVAIGAARWVAPDGAHAQTAPASVDGVSSNTRATESRTLRARFTIAPYGWMSGIGGETGVRDLSADVDVTFGDMLSHLKFAAMGAFEVDYGPWLGAVDGIYTSLGADRTRSIGPGQIDLEMTMKTLVAQGFVGYSFVPAPTLAIDVLAGARLWAIDASLKKTGIVDTTTRSRDPTWGDALGALRLRWRANERWHVSAAGDGGGGGSRGTGGALATVAYDFSVRWALFGAYRYLYLNYRKNDFFFKGHFDGPALGGAYRW